MKNKNVFLIAFIILALIQLAVPMQMIWHNNDIAFNGKIYKFKCQPVDPYDAFRGKYIYLNYALSSINLKKKIDDQKPTYAILATDKKGFATISAITNLEPKHGDYVKIKISSVSEYSNHFQVWITYPFDRFYMNEYKAPQAEIDYSESVRNSNKNVYAIVAIKNGEGIIKEVMIDNQSLKTYIDKNKRL